jgi:hypothetical protein
MHTAVPYLIRKLALLKGQKSLRSFSPRCSTFQTLLDIRRRFVTRHAFEATIMKRFRQKLSR